MQDVEMVRELMASLEEAVELSGAVLPVRNYNEVLEKAEKSVAGEELYADAIEAWGANSQLDMTVEECSELIKAIQKFKRKEGGEIWGKAYSALVDAMAEEVADVEIMCTQMRLLVGTDEVRDIKIVKLQKLRKMLDEEKARQNT